jgi:hypothetical protein
VDQSGRQIIPIDSGLTGALGEPDRRSVLAGLMALLAAPQAAVAASPQSWEIGTQILAGARVRDPSFLAMALQALAEEVGEPIVDRVLDAVLSRDAANIGKPFPDGAVEAAARRFVDIVYTGEVPTPGGVKALGFHQALAWQVLHFTKPPSVCGPGFGWWTDPPDAS